MKQTMIIKLAALFSLIFTPTLFLVLVNVTGMSWLWWIMTACLAIDSIAFFLILPMASAGENGFQISLADSIRMRAMRVPYERIFRAMAMLRDAGHEVSSEQLIEAARKGLDPVHVAQEYIDRQEPL
jgi:uncharacterized protein YqfA (UPF0365 family)